MKKVNKILFFFFIPIPFMLAQSPDPPGAGLHLVPYILERDRDVAKEQPGPHNGGGTTIGYSFFEKAEGLYTIFRKRVLKPGAAIGYHLQQEDEIYYILSGKGTMQMNGETFEVQAGDAILTRPGSSHGLQQVGAEDLVVLIVYEERTP